MKQILTLFSFAFIVMLAACEDDLQEGNNTIKPINNLGYEFNIESKHYSNQLVAKALAKLFYNKPIVETKAAFDMELPLYAQINRIVLATARYGVDGYFFIPFETLVENCAKEDIDLLSLLNEQIKEDLPANYENLKAVIYNEDGETPLHILIPYLDDMLGASANDDGTVNFTDKDLMQLWVQQPYIAFDQDNETYPVQGYVNSKLNLYLTDITKTQANENLCYYIADNPISECIIDGQTCFDAIIPCYGLARTDNCDDCNPPDYSVIPEQDGGGNIGSEELIIVLSKNDENWDVGCVLIEGNEDFDINFTGDNDENIVEPYVNYAKLEALPGQSYYILDGDYGGDLIRTIRHAPKAFASSYTSYQGQPPTLKFGNKLHLCYEHTNFRMWSEYMCGESYYNEGSSMTWCNVGHYGITQGGIFKLSSPFKPSVYFVLPYGKQFWFNIGPDLIVNYKRVLDGECGEGVDRYFTDLFIDACDLCTGLEVFDLEKDALITTDFNKISEFWSTPKIYVDLGGEKTFDNKLLFDGASTNTYTGSELYKIGELSKVTVYPNGNSYTNTAYEYQISAPLSKYLYPGDEVEICVNASFGGGHTIQQCKKHILKSNGAPNPDADVAKRISTFITGHIVDYNVKIYHQ